MRPSITGLRADKHENRERKTQWHIVDEQMTNVQCRERRDTDIRSLWRVK